MIRKEELKRADRNFERIAEKCYETKLTPSWILDTLVSMPG